MKLFLLPILAGVMLAPLVLVAAGKPAPAVVSEPSPPPKSVFVIDPQFGKDPFYPKSDRMIKLLPKPADTILVPPPPVFPDEFRCQGIAGIAGRRIAIVNGKSMEKNEKVDFRLPSGQTVKATCVEIKESSVVIEINGVTKELPLRAGLK